MANKHTQGSRAHRFEKKRKSTILMNWLVGAGSALLIVFIAMMAFGGDDQPSNAKGSDEEKTVLNSESDQEENTEQGKNNDGSKNNQTNKQESEQDESKGSDPNSSSNSDDEDDSNNEESSNDDESSNKEQDKDASEEENDVVIEESDKENVAKIVKKDWEPVPTEMNTSGNHNISYNKDSQDWNELIKAVSKATGLSEDNMITWWVGNGGSPQKAEATVSNKEKTEHYRVFIQWVDGEGYKPVKLEVLEEKEVNR
ncbi:Protein of unknown function [Halobacillus alkaliphilus]|uniref:DUF1510 domain-containing protein n=1 Tax=Halobacillus alkaliphilus TaxID=396056 RepID=A0A1I2JJL5_9BACI|nr:YrrS family protein [Halobacillus alkaliphilus]SFF53016.1 Protein of unknown function [Halobacillus alkaliphilus]